VIETLIAVIVPVTPETAMVLFNGAADVLPQAGVPVGSGIAPTPVALNVCALTLPAASSANAPASQMERREQ
jgi:hypothetical protein